MDIYPYRITVKSKQAASAKSLGYGYVNQTISYQDLLAAKTYKKPMGFCINPKCKVRLVPRCNFIDHYWKNTGLFKLKNDQEWTRYSYTKDHNDDVCGHCGYTYFWTKVFANIDYKD